MKWRRVPTMGRRFLWWSWRFEVTRRDAWIGASWDTSRDGVRTDVWVCLVPMLPLHLRRLDPPF